MTAYVGTPLQLKVLKVEEVEESEANSG